MIITYGRSGSTLLQGLLNSIDGCLVRGENHDLCRGLFASYQSIRKARQQFGKGSSQPTSPWYGAGALDEELFIRDARSLVRNQLLGGMSEKDVACLGFKEIRYIPALQDRFDPGQLNDYLDFLHKLFPNPAFLFLSRDHGSVSGSAWWQTRDPEKVKRRLAEFDQWAGEYAEGKDWVYAITYEDLVARSSRIRGLFDFMGAPYIEERVESVFQTRHSYTSGPSPQKKREG